MACIHEVVQTVPGRRRGDSQRRADHPVRVRHWRSPVDRARSTDRRGCARPRATLPRERHDVRGDLSAAVRLAKASHAIVGQARTAERTQPVTARKVSWPAQTRDSGWLLLARPSPGLVGVRRLCGVAGHPDQGDVRLPRLRPPPTKTSAAPLPARMLQLASSACSSPLGLLTAMTSRHGQAVAQSRRPGPVRFP